MGTVLVLVSWLGQPGYRLACNGHYFSLQSFSLLGAHIIVLGSGTRQSFLLIGMLIFVNLMCSAHTTQGLINGNHNFELEDGTKLGGGLWVSILLADASLSLMHDLVGVWQARPGTHRALQDSSTQTDNVLYKMTLAGFATTLAMIARV